MKIAFYIPTLAGGGAERVVVTLANAFADRGHQVHLVVHRAQGPLRQQLESAVQVVQLRRSAKIRGRLAALRAVPDAWHELAGPVLLARQPIMGLRYLDGLTRYLARERPQVIVSALFYANLVAVWARRLARVPTRVLVTHHNTLSIQIGHGRAGRDAGRWRRLGGLIGHGYRQADCIVAVSDGVADDLAAVCCLPRARITTVYNPVVAVDRVWAPPADESALNSTIVAIGRLTWGKAFDVLLDAFAALPAGSGQRLVILGEGEDREALLARARQLGIAGRVDLPGFVDRPEQYLRRAALFVLSSRHEGLPTVLIEAMACGCPVVSTDCPSGPREILANGAIGPLVPVDDSRALARAMAQRLAAPRDGARLQRNAARFAIGTAVDHYERLCRALERACG